MSHSSGLGYDMFSPELQRYKLYSKDEDNPFVSLVREYHHLIPERVG